MQEFHIEGVKHIAPEVALELIEKNEAVLIDVREIHEVANESAELNNVFYLQDFPNVTNPDGGFET